MLASAFTTPHLSYSTQPQACRALYVKRTEQLLHRVNSISGVSYRSDPTIIIWELCNECRCRLRQGAQYAPEANTALHDWTAFAARVVKQISPHQVSPCHTRSSPHRTLVRAL